MSTGLDCGRHGERSEHSYLVPFWGYYGELASKLGPFWTLHGHGELASKSEPSWTASRPTCVDVDVDVDLRPASGGVDVDASRSVATTGP